MANQDVCSFDPCDRVMYCKNLCQGHYNQQYKGRELTPFIKSRKNFQAKSNDLIPRCAFINCNNRISRKSSSCGKCVRGILCNSCNAAEGFLKSNPNLALGLAEYIIMNSRQYVITGDSIE